jgi:carboxypeptidase C (cathepsin A)
MPDETKPAAPEKPAAPAASEPPASFETTHQGSFGGTTVAYRAIAAELDVPDAEGKPRARIFSFTYLSEPADIRRPVIFAFNGGPGSASLWLHMGVLGPRRVVCPSDGSPAGSGPYEVVDNELCPLERADIVFIDPPGTGYSAMAGTYKPEDAWGLEQDAEIVSGFIKAWLTRHRRWSSPRYLVGESYGTTRAIAVAGKLAGGLAGVAFNGIGLVSAILDFHTARFQHGNPLPDASYLPSYTATALHHGLIQAPDGRDKLLDDSRRFAMMEYLPALVAASRLAPAETSRIAKRLSQLTGLSEAWLHRAHLRIEPSRFRKELLRTKGLTIGRFDSRYTGRDFDEVGELPDSDPSSYGMDSAFVSTANDHLGRVLGIDWQRPYTVFNRKALENWDWLGPKKEGQMRWPGYVNVAPTLGQLLRENPELRIWIANGIFDLATPFHAVENTIAGNGIETARVRMTYYDAGHMMYLHAPSFTALGTDLRELVRPAA